MKLLLTLPRPLFPADTGGTIRSLNVFSRLASRFEISAVSFADPDIDATAINEMRRMFHTYTPVFWQEKRKYSAGFYLELLTSQFSSLPYFLAKSNLSSFRSTIQEIVDRERFDLILCYFLHTAVHLSSLKIRPQVVIEHNVEYLLRRRQWQVERHPLKKRIFAREWRKTHDIEARVCQACDHVI